MSKKKTVVVKNPEVSNNINMNLTHNDVIEVAIQSQLEILEPQLEKLNKRENELKKQLGTLQKEVIEKTVKNVVKDDDAAFFFNSLKALEKLHKQNIEWQASSIYFNNNKSCEHLSSEKYRKCEYSISRLEEYKNPIAMLRNYTVETNTTWTIGNDIHFDLHASVNGIKIYTDKPVRVTVEKAVLEEWKKKVKEILKEIYFVYDSIYLLTEQILDLKYNDRKVKARVVKASLSKTEEGRNILALLESATNVKLLS